MSKNTVTVKTFTRKLGSFVKTQAKLIAEVHGLVTFALDHSYEHGDCIYLNRTWERMNGGMRAQFRRYVIDVCAEDTNDLATSWLTIEKDAFVINTEIKQANRVTFYRVKGEAPVRLDRPADLFDKPCFMNIDPDKQPNPFTDKRVLEGLLRLQRSMNKDDSKVNAPFKTIVDTAYVAAKKATEDQPTVH